MTYAIIKVTDGNYAVHAEGISSAASAKITYHQLCAALWNEPSVGSATVEIVDENLDAVLGYKELITHPKESSNEPE